MAAAEGESVVTGEGVDVVLRDGATVRVRGVRSGDRESLEAFFRKLSPESVYLRFFGNVPTQGVIDRTLAADGRQEHETLLAQSLEAVGRGPRLEGPASEHRGAGSGDRLGYLVEL